MAQNEEILKKLDSIDARVAKLEESVSTGRISLKILSWLGATVLGIITAWDWLVAHIRP